MWRETFGRQQDPMMVGMICVSLPITADPATDRRRSRPATFCPVARAACRALGFALGNVQVSGDVISIWGWKGYEYLRVATTHKLERAAMTFDREKRMQPNRFRVNLTPKP